MKKASITAGVGILLLAAVAGAVFQLQQPIAANVPSLAHRKGQRAGRNPARITVTSRRTAALEGRLRAAASACRP